MAEVKLPDRPKVLRFTEQFPKKAQFGERLRLRIVQGEDVGHGFCLLGDSISIGRDDTCDLPLRDERASRRHVELNWKKDRYFASDLDSANGLIINGKRVKASFLDVGDILTIGNAMLEVIAVSAETPLGANAKILKAAPKENKKADALKKKRNLVLGVLIMAALWAISSSDQAMTFRERAFMSFVDQDKPEKKLTKKEGKEAIHDFIPASNPNAPGFRQAQRFFREGMRELQAKNFRRAISAFETAQTVDPSHNEAKVYVDIAKKALATEVESNYRAAVSSVKAQRYREAKTYYLAVVRLLEKDPDNKYFQDATAALKTIDVKNQTKAGGQ